MVIGKDNHLKINMDNHSTKDNINQNSKWTIVEQLLNNIGRIEKNIYGFKAHDKAIYTSGPLLNKEEAAEVQEFISIIKQLHAEIDKKGSNWLVIPKKLDKITKYYEQEEEDYDSVDGIVDNLKFIQKNLARLVKEISTNETFNHVGKELSKALIEIIKRAITESIRIEDMINILTDVIISSL